jgi:hypothetical protein
MTFPEEKPLPEDQNQPEEQAGQPDAKSPRPENESPADDSAQAAETDDLENATFPIEPEEPVDLSEIFQAREFKIEDFDPDAENNFIPLATSNEPPTRTTVRRSRRPRRVLISRPEIEQIDERLESMARRAAPTIDLFIFAGIAGALIGIGYLLDSPAILLFSLLIAPVLAPWAGMILSSATGETQFFGQTLGGILTTLLLVFVTSVLAGLLSRLWLPLTFSQAFLHARFWWPDIVLLVLGTIIFIVTFIQSEEKPLIANIMLAYELFLPISAAGFGLGNNVDGLWPEALLVFMVHLALSLIVGLATFYYMGFRPTDNSGYALSGAAIILSLLLVAGIAGLGSILESRPAMPTPEMPTVTATQPIVTAAATFTPAHTPTRLPPSPTAIQATATAETATPTITPLPTPVYGRISSPGDGAVIRIEPAGSAITTVQNGYLVEILPDAPIFINNESWVHVIVKTPARDIDGWVLLSLISTGTP